MGSDCYLVLVGRDNPDSWDPLDFDKSNNIVLGRLAYLTPIEADASGALTSNLLSRFVVSDDKMSLEFEIKQNLKFEDGSLVTIEDLRLSILRMAMKRPNFPILEDIVGLTDWSKLKSPLLTSPAGIKIGGHNLRIEFKVPQRNPLFRFTLELFAVIPEKCINKINGELICKRPPESGLYRFLTDSSLSKESRKIHFKKRDLGTPDSRPENIILTYEKDESRIKDLMKGKNRVVIATSGILTSPDNQLLKLSGSHVQLTARSWFAILRFNKDSKIFETNSDRNVFVATFLYFLKLGSKNSYFIPERSIFTEIMPGFIPTEFELPAIAKSKTARKIVFNYSAIEDKNFLGAFEKTCQRLNFQCILQADKSISPDLSLNRTGFWAMDPVGDLKMLFTPDLHEVLRPQWENKELLNLINDTYRANSPEELSQKAKSVNLYFRRDSLFNPVAHFQFIYISNWVPEKPVAAQAISLPYPWHLFE